jgi:hypothetical protein
LRRVIEVLPSAGCLDKERLVTQVKNWLGDRCAGAGTELRVHGDPNHPSALIFDLVHGDTTSRRVFDPAPSNCDEAHAVLGLAIALALDEDRMEERLREVQPSRTLRRLGLQLGIGYAVLPKASVGAQLGTELTLWSWLSARVDALVQNARGNTIPGSQGHFDAWLAAGSLQICAGGFLDPRLRLVLCAGPALGAVRARGQGYAPNLSSSGLWLSARSGLRVEARLGLLWLLDVEIISSVLSPTFQARRDSAAPFRRPSDPTGVLFSFGPALPF